MTAVGAKASATTNNPIPLQSASVDIWDKKYRLKTKQGETVDADVAETYRRVAHALAEVEEREEDREAWYERFYWALENGAIPAGRIVSNAGAQSHKTRYKYNKTVLSLEPSQTPWMASSVLFVMRV